MLSRTRFARALQPTWARLAQTHPCGLLGNSWLLLRRAPFSTDPTNNNNNSIEEEQHTTESLFSVPTESNRSYGATPAGTGYDTLPTQKVSMQDISRQVAQSLAGRLQEGTEEEGEGENVTDNETSAKQMTGHEAEEGDASVDADAAALQEHAATASSTSTKQQKKYAVKGDAEADVSYGEEELQEEERHAAESANNAPQEFSAERELMDEARQNQADKASLSQSNTKHTENKNNNAAASDAAYVPVSLTFSSHYSDELSELLSQAAKARHFRCPIWSTQEAYAAAEIQLTVPEKDGLLVTTMPPSPFYLYNLEQTNYPDAANAVPEAVRAELRRRTAFRTSHLNEPHDITGLRLRSRTLKTIMEHPTFAQLQARSPVWIAIQDIRLLNLHLRPGELANYILVPRNLNNRAANNSAAAHNWANSVVYKDLMRDYGTPLGIDLMKYSLYYHSTQLVEAATFASVPEKVLICRSIRGTLYGPGLAYLMRQYCRRYYFPDTGVAVFLTLEQLSKLGGRVVQTPRTPQSLLNKTSHSSTPSSVNESDASLAVVPPPFTTMYYGEVLTLYNAEQTDKPEFLQNYAKRARAELMDRYSPESKNIHSNNNSYASHASWPTSNSQSRNTHTYNE